ncbi:MAG: extracellular solute-binding protein [Proteobacteria bacterium]|nr:extracellular solute-binding protein [Pseudomonadota bacterium]
MKIGRRDVLKGGAAAAVAAGTLPAGRALAQAKEINISAASFSMREPILNEFTKRTGIVTKPWVNPSSQARVDRIRVAPIDIVEVGCDFMNYAWDEKLIQPIEVARLSNWKDVHPLLRDGRASPDLPYCKGDNPGLAMYVDKERTKIKFVPYMFQMDSIGYNTAKVPAVNNTLSWGELFNPKWRGKVALFGIDWLGMLDAALGMEALGLLKPADVSNLTEKEVDTVILFLKEKKKEGHFRALWKAYGELVNLMASEEVWIADAWWPVIVEVSKKGIPLRYAVAKEGYRAWTQGACLSKTCKDLDVAYQWMNNWLEGFAGARQSEIGYFSPIKTYEKYLKPEEVAQWYGGVGRDGGSIDERCKNVYVWNTRPKNQEYYTEKWNEFLAA